MGILSKSITAQEYITVENILDRAVLEAGFATEPLRHCLKELYECLYLRMLSDGEHGFTEKEWQACQDAKKLLGLSAR